MCIKAVKINTILTMYNKDIIYSNIIKNDLDLIQNSVALCVGERRSVSI